MEKISYISSLIFTRVWKNEAKPLREVWKRYVYEKLPQIQGPTSFLRIVLNES